MIDQEIQAKLREKFNPDGSMLRKQQLRMLEILLYIDKVCKENNIKLPDGRMIIPDVIATISPYHRHFIEVECGNHHQNDFNDKCNRLASLSRSIIIVGGSRNEVTRLLKPQVENFIRFKGRNVLKISQTDIYLFSISDLSKGIITYHYDMSSDEPVCGFGRKGKEV